MNIQPLAFGLASLCLVVAPLAWAQPTADAPAASAPAPVPSAKTGPRLISPSEARDNATAPGELRPERRVTPQISVPLGRRNIAADNASKTPDKPPARPGSPAAANGEVDDPVARCEARRGEQVRAKCRDELARQNRAR